MASRARAHLDLCLCAPESDPHVGVHCRRRNEVSLTFHTSACPPSEPSVAEEAVRPIRRVGILVLSSRASNDTRHSISCSPAPELQRLPT